MLFLGFLSTSGNSQPALWHHLDVINSSAANIIYIDVLRDSVVLYPDGLNIPASLLSLDVGPFEDCIKVLEQGDPPFRVFLLARPGSVGNLRHVLKRMADRVKFVSVVPVSMDLKVRKTNGEFITPLELYQLPGEPKWRGIAPTIPRFFECRNKGVYPIDVDGLMGQMRDLLEWGVINPRAAQQLLAAGQMAVSNDLYRAVLRTSASLEIFFELKEDVSGEGGFVGEVGCTEEQFNTLLDRMDREHEFVFFLVRDGSDGEFADANRAAMLKGFVTVVDVLKADDPIRFGFSNSPTETGTYVEPGDSPEWH